MKSRNTPRLGNFFLLNELQRVWKLVEYSIVKHPRIRSLSLIYDPNLEGILREIWIVVDLYFDREVKVSRVP